ncbi:YobI family P-loop NTPase [Corynebacterium pyruviciproducens]
MKHEMDSSKKTVKKDSAQVIRVSSNISRWQPRPLTPKFDPEKHEGYVLKLMKLLADWGNRNIALTGTYGTGKSSIITGLLKYLDEISRGNFSQRGKTKILEAIDLERLKGIKPIVVSLPTLNKDLASSALEDPTEVTHATSPTNNIQREVVKQLLYRENPQRMRESNFRRIVPVSFTRKVATYTVFAVLITFIIATFQGLFSSDPTDSLQKPCYYAVVFSIAFIFCWLIDWLVIYKPTIKSLSLNSTKIELDKGSVSYFDQYLDEIIYYFLQSGTNLVVFEDLDRYGEPYIFETLKELNELINIALQTGRDRTITTNDKQPVRFLFATRDSALSSFTVRRRPENAEEEPNATENTDHHPSKGQNQDHLTRVGKPEDRIKFFDAIVPVVPFSGSYNAYQYLHDELTVDSHCPVDQRLLEIVGREIVDYRVLNNIVNEYLVFAEELTRSSLTDRGESFVDLNELFALMVFKALTPQEFELIPAGQSSLDKFQSYFDQLHQDILEKIDLERSLAMEAMHLGKVRESQAKQLNDLVAEYAHTVNSSFDRADRIYVDDKEFPSTDEMAADLWTEFLDNSSEDKLASLKIFDQYRYSVKVGEFYLRLILKQVIYEDVFKKGPLEDCRHRLQNLRRLESDLEFASYEEMYEELTDDGYGFLSEYVPEFEATLRELFQTDAIIRLIKSGYITHRFYLYSTNFVSGINSPETQIFLTNNLERNKPVPYRALSTPVIKHLSNKFSRDDSYFDSLAMYNGYLFCGLYADGNFNLQLAGLARKLSEKLFPKDLAADFIRSVARNSPRLSKAPESSFSKNSFKSLVFITKHQNALLDLGLENKGESRSEELEAVLLDAVILGMEDSTWLDSDRSIEIFRERYSETSALSEPGVLSDSQLEVLVATMVEKEIYLEDLTHLTSSVQAGIAKAGLFEINKPNIATIAHLPGDIQALDIALDLEADLFYRLVKNLGEFIHVARELQVSIIKSPDKIVPVLLALYDETRDDSSAQLLCDSLEVSPPPVGDIAELPDGVVSALLKKDWLQPSADVIHNLILRCESDSNEEESSTVTEEDIYSFVEKNPVLSPSKDSRRNRTVAEFIVSRDIDSYDGDEKLLRVKSLGNFEPLLDWTELGELTSSKVNAIVEARLVERNGSSYASLKQNTEQWSCWETYLNVSDAEDWLSEEDIHGPEEAQFIIISKALPTALRQAALEIASDNFELGNRWLAVAESTDPFEFQLTFEQIITAIKANDSEEYSKAQLPLLAHLLADYDRRQDFDDFQSGLESFGGEFAKLVIPGRGRAKLPNSELVYKAFEIVEGEGGAANSIVPKSFSSKNEKTVFVYRKYQ